MARNERIDTMLELCSSIPRGRVMGYAQLGDLVGTSGRIIGRWLNLHGSSTCWWRVIGSDGEIRTYKYNPAMGAEQAERLRTEGVRFLPNGKVDRTCFVDSDRLG